jgi:hypothetical protein
MGLLMYGGVPMDVGRFRDWIEAEFARKWLATQQALESQPRAAHHTKSFHGFVCISRAGWLETAGSAHEDGQICFVETQRQQSDPHSYCLLRRGCTLSGAKGNRRA